ncbi:MAG: hypothetical protein EXR95_10970 [Gemmatimonadetes bacterium]|nr:hypothetical protein [Gemmatimonadota bacterium]
MRHGTSLSIAFAMVVLGAAATPRLADSPPDSPIAKLGWLAGCWERTAGNRIVEEQWTRPRGRTMLGMSRTVVGDSTITYETMRIYERGTSLVYAAAPSGQAPAEFVAEAPTDTLAVFSNLAHDFPQRVIYRKGRADSLFARVEGISRGVLRGSDFRMARVACVG